MIHTAFCDTLLGRVLIAADQDGLTGLWFQHQKYFAAGIGAAETDPADTIILQTKQWLKRYFAGEAPAVDILLNPKGTPFQKMVWQQLLAIPYGETTTYAAIAKRIAVRKGSPHFSAQAVGGAVGHNPISMLIPCHRVIGTDGSLTGYAGGIEKKLALLHLEGVTIG